ncbi:hypothetical protein [uncultured Tateyamaria sp.]|nr:hypothetical protein [uncultured Tateyamaria sp.]
MSADWRTGVGRRAMIRADVGGSNRQSGRPMSLDELVHSTPSLLEA